MALICKKHSKEEMDRRRAFTPVKMRRNLRRFNEPKGSTPKPLARQVSLAINYLLGI